MKAARLHEIGTSLKVEEVAEPDLKPGGAIVKVLASHVPNFMSGIVSGKLDYYVMPLPFIPEPGAIIAVVEAVADDVFGLEVGQKVFCDINMATKSNNAPPEKILIGITALTPNAGSLQQLWRDGTFAEKVCDLNAIKTHVFPLDKVNDAVSKAATLRGLEYSIVVPNSNSF